MWQATSTAVNQGKEAVLQGITSEQAMSALKVQSAQITSEFLNWLKTATESAGDFVAKETPNFVHEFLVWNFAKACIYSGFCLFWVFIILIAVRKLWKWAKDTYKPEDDDIPRGGMQFITLIPLVIPMLIIMLGFTPYLMEAIKIKVAPRVYLVDWLTEAVTGHNVSDANTNRQMRQ